MRKADLAEAAVILRRLLAALDRGELSTGTGAAVAMVRRVEGAALAFETASNTGD